MRLLSRRVLKRPNGQRLRGTDETISRGVDRPWSSTVFRPPSRRSTWRRPEQRSTAVPDILAPKATANRGWGRAPRRPGAAAEAHREHGLPEEAFRWYLDLRRFGSFPTRGFRDGHRAGVSPGSAASSTCGKRSRSPGCSTGSTLTCWRLTSPDPAGGRDTPAECCAWCGNGAGAAIVVASEAPAFLFERVISLLFRSERFAATWPVPEKRAGDRRAGDRRRLARVHGDVGRACCVEARLVEEGEPPWCWRHPPLPSPRRRPRCRLAGPSQLFLDWIYAPLAGRQPVLAERLPGRGPPTTLRRFCCACVRGGPRGVPADPRTFRWSCAGPRLGSPRLAAASLDARPASSSPSGDRAPRTPGRRLRSASPTARCCSPVGRRDGGAPNHVRVLDTEALQAAGVAFRIWSRPPTWSVSKPGYGIVSDCMEPERPPSTPSAGISRSTVMVREMPGYLRPYTCR